MRASRRSLPAVLCCVQALVTGAVGVEGGSAWRRVFSSHATARPSELTWLEFVSKCGSAAISANATSAEGAFRSQFVGQVVEWDGAVVGIGPPPAAAQGGEDHYEIRVKMEPTDAWRHDLALRVPAALSAQLMQASTGSRVRFQAELVSFGGRWGTHVLKLRALSVLREAEARLEAEAAGGPAVAADAAASASDRSWDSFRAECGMGARRANPFRAARSYAQHYAGQEVSWSGRVWGASTQRRAAAADTASSEGEALAVIQVKMHPPDAWTYDVTVRIAAALLSSLPATKDYVTFTGALAPLEGEELGARTEVVVHATSLIVLPHQLARQRKDEL